MVVADNVVDEQGDEEGSAQGADQSDTAVLGVILFLDGLAGDAGVHVGQQDGNAGDGVGVTGGHGSGQAADHEHHADDRGQCVGSHVSKGVVAAGQGVTIHGGDGEAAHADDGGNKAPAEQQDAGVGHRTHFSGDGECADVDRVRLAEEQGADAQKEQAKRGSTRKKHFHRTSYTVRASALFLDDS